MGELAMTKTFKGGILLFLAGIFLLFRQLGFFPAPLFFPVLGLGFCMAYLLFGGRKEYGSIGFLIPGAVLLAIGCFAVLQEYPVLSDYQAGLFFLILGLGFLAVFVVHTFWFKGIDHGGRFWPLYTSGGLILFAVIITAAIMWDFRVLQVLNYLWILALLGAGAWLLLRGRKD